MKDRRPRWGNNGTKRCAKKGCQNQRAHDWRWCSRCGQEVMKREFPKMTFVPKTAWDDFDINPVFR